MSATEPPDPPAPELRRAFQLRFATQREPGRSRVSAVQPQGVPATVTDKFYSTRGEVDERLAAAALRRIERAFACGPRERLAAPQLASHEYGWHRAPALPPAPRHHIRDSAWLKAQVKVLAADARLKPR